MERIRRINLYGAPGSGKSTSSAELFSSLKKFHINVELVREYFKYWAYEKKNPDGYCQLYGFAKQTYEEYRLLSNGVDCIVTDSPIMLNVAYGTMHKNPGVLGMLDIAREYEQKYPAVHILLKRDRAWPYQQTGRFEDITQIEDTEKKLIDFVRAEVELEEFTNLENIKSYVRSRVMA
jgi:hypothetical protein